MQLELNSKISNKEYQIWSKMYFWKTWAYYGHDTASGVFGQGRKKAFNMLGLRHNSW